MITTETKAKVMGSVQRHKTDTGSPESQVAILTQRINEVNAHLKEHKHDFLSRRGLLQMVGRRKRLLKYLQDQDYEAYTKLIAKLGLRK